MTSNRRRWLPMLAALAALAVAGSWIGRWSPRAGDAGTVVRHLWAARHPAYLRWRLETFGLYWPSYLHERPWWRVNPAAVAELTRLLPRYLSWIAATAALRRAGDRAVWRRQLAARDEVWRASLGRLERDA